MPAESPPWAAPADAAAASRIRVHVHLPIEQDHRVHRDHFLRGEWLDESPYGYHRAEQHGFRVTFSESYAESGGARLLRKAFARLLGFDLVHAWRNREALRAAQVIWTHTEREHLAVLMLQRLSAAKDPPIIAQSVWLFDRWSSLAWPLRSLYSALLRHAGLLTMLSSENRRLAQSLLPDRKVLRIPYGIAIEAFLQDAPPIAPRPAGRPARIIAVGNDVHRDWPTLVSAIAGQPDLALTILTPRVAAVQALAAGAANIEVRSAANVAELKAGYDSSLLLVVPLRPNLHASGITVMLEGAARGIPMVCTDVGGLRDYFAGEEVCYVPAGDADALRRAILDLAADPDRRASLARAARARLLREDYSSERYVVDHCRLSRELLGLAESTPRSGGPSSPAAS
jgi:glycosyltransferase involved in cell wall biosynthesis